MEPRVVRFVGAPRPFGEAFAELAVTIGLGPQSPRHFLARVDGEPAATCSLFLGAGVAGIYDVSTLPELRKRGLGRLITRAAMREARARGYRMAILHSSTLGAGIYRALGFRDVCAIGQHVWPPRRLHGTDDVSLGTSSAASISTSSIMLRGRIAPGMRVFDAGCGGGRNLVYLLGHGYDVCGNDAIRMRSPRCARWPHRCRLAANSISRRADRADLVSRRTCRRRDVERGPAFARDGRQFEGMLRQMWRVLKPGGVFFRGWRAPSASIPT